MNRVVTRSLVVAALLVSCALPARAERPAAAGPYDIDVLEDGTTLVFARTPDSRMASFRFVVRAGGNNDPDKRAGLAHLLEHLIFHGTYEIQEGDIFHDVAKAGGTVNAFTGPDATTYAIDAPKPKFLSLIEAMSAMVTSPALPFAKLEREKKVVDAEHMDRSALGMMYALDQQLYPSRNRGQTIIGTKDSRAEISLDEIREFYERFYVPTNAAIIIAGDFTMDEVKAALSRGLKWAPRLPAPPRDEPAQPNVPSEVKALYWVTAIGSAYLADGMSRDACDAAGALIDMRFRRRLTVEAAGASSTSVFCHEARGHQFIVAFAFTSSGSTGNNMPNLMEEERFEQAKTEMPTAQEKQALDAHARARYSVMIGRAEAIADRLAEGASNPAQTIESGAFTALNPPHFDWAAAQKALATSITEQNFVLIHFSPFEES